jgi:hypothetical protein
MFSLPSLRPPRRPSKCILCLRSGHRAFHCRSPPCAATSSQLPPNPTAFARLSQPPSSSSGRATAAMESHPLVGPASSKPGSPSSRVDRVEACVACTPAMVEAENVYHSRGLIAIALCDDPWYRVSLR